MAHSDCGWKAGYAGVLSVDNACYSWAPCKKDASCGDAIQIDITLRDGKEPSFIGFGSVRVLVNFFKWRVLVLFSSFIKKRVLVRFVRFGSIPISNYIILRYLT